MSIYISSYLLGICSCCHELSEQQPLVPPTPDAWYALFSGTSLVATAAVTVVNKADGESSNNGMQSPSESVVPGICPDGLNGFLLCDSRRGHIYYIHTPLSSNCLLSLARSYGLCSCYHGWSDCPGMCLLPMYHRHTHLHTWSCTTSCCKCEYNIHLIVLALPASGEDNVASMLAASQQQSVLDTCAIVSCRQQWQTMHAIMQ